MIDKIKMVRELKQKLIDNFGDNIVHVILFGSQATGTANELGKQPFIINAIQNGFAA